MHVLKQLAPRTIYIANILETYRKSFIKKAGIEKQYDLRA